jgi:hypothetical protein
MLNNRVSSTMTKHDCTIPMEIDEVYTDVPDVDMTDICDDVVQNYSNLPGTTKFINLNNNTSVFNAFQKVAPYPTCAARGCLNPCNVKHGNLSFCSNHATAHDQIRNLIVPLLHGRTGQSPNNIQQQVIRDMHQMIQNMYNMSTAEFDAFKLDLQTDIQAREAEQDFLKDEKQDDGHKYRLFVEKMTLAVCQVVC